MGEEIGTIFRKNRREGDSSLVFKRKENDRVREEISQLFGVREKMAAWQEKRKKIGIQIENLSQNGGREKKRKRELMENRAQVRSSQQAQPNEVADSRVLQKKGEKRTRVNQWGTPMSTTKRTD